jgi:large subunit ribosomal protein L13e
MSTEQPKIFKQDGKQREGRGFSRGELAKAGSHMKEALKLHIPLDPRRKTVHDENVETLQKLLETRKPAVKAEKKSKS